MGASCFFTFLESRNSLVNTLVVYSGFLGDDIFEDLAQSSIP